MIDTSIVTYQEKYLESLIELWNKELIYDPINERRFTELYIYTQDFDPSLILLKIKEEKVIGFIVGVRRKTSYYTKGLEPDRAWIINMAVDINHQQQHIGTTLYKTLVDKFKERGSKEVTLCAFSPNYLAPGIDIRYEKGLAFFRKMGYVLETPAVSMERELWSFTYTDIMIEKEDKLLAQGIEIQTYKPEYFDSLVSFMEKEFEPGWLRNILNALSEGNAEETLIVVLKDKEVLGFCLRNIDGNDHRFGPIGIAASLRSLGLGSVLFNRMMLEMRKQGLFSTYFLWTSGSAIQFYERLGMRICREYRVGRKDISYE